MLNGLAGWHVLILTALSIVPFVLWLIAIIQIAGSRAAAGPVVGWVILVTLVPLVGAILWFVIGRASLRRESPPVQPN